jgi:hypothetical protein
MLKISAVYLIGKAEIPIHYTIWALVEQALLNKHLNEQKLKSFSCVCTFTWIEIISIRLIGVQSNHGVEYFGGPAVPTQ